MTEGLEEIGLRELLVRYREDPVYFVRKEFKAEPDGWQVEALKEFPKHPKIAMKASKGPGKTCVLAWCAWNYLCTRKGSQIAACSVTGDNLKDGLWKEMAYWQSKSYLLSQSFTWTNTRITNNAHPAYWFMSARKWPKSGSSEQHGETWAGLHAKYMMAMMDEAGGIPDSVAIAAEAVLTGNEQDGGDCKVMIAGNTVRRDGPLWRANLNKTKSWKVITVNGDPDSLVRSPRVSMKWARDMIAEFGRENAWVKVNVFGEFPEVGIDQLFDESEIDEAMERQVRRDNFEFAQKRLGIDVARFGDDSSIVLPRQGLQAYEPRVRRNLRTEELVHWIMNEKAVFGSDMELIDDTGGWAAGSIDGLRLLGVKVIPVNFGSRPFDRRYLNRRAEMAWLCKQWVLGGGILPNDVELKKELLAQTYTYNTGKLQLEDKDLVKQKLGGRSPDKADALFLTFAMPDDYRPFTMEDMVQKQIRENLATQGERDYDPFDVRRKGYDPFSESRW